VDQGEIVHQFYSCGDGQGGTKVASQYIASYQGQHGLEMSRHGTIFRLPPLVNPAQVVPEQVVQETLARGKPFAQLLF
jgi:hypothetical protein